MHADCPRPAGLQFRVRAPAPPVPRASRFSHSPARESSWLPSVISHSHGRLLMRSLHPAYLFVPFLFGVSLGASAAAKPDRQVAITIDDLPAASAATMPAATMTEMTTKLLTTIRDQKAPVVGFVNEKKL